MTYQTFERPAPHAHAASTRLSRAADRGRRVATRLLAGAACLLTMTTYAIAAEKPELDPRCAAKDMELVTQIEQYGEAQEMSAEILVEAFSIVGKARRTCQMGQVQDALGFYESLGLSRVRSSRAQ